MRLKISRAIAYEWDARCICDVIPGLADVDYDTGVIEVSADVAKEIAADCEFYMDPRAVDASVGERSAYRALRKQIGAAA